MFFKADSYEVQGSGNKWKANVFQGLNVIEEIPAVSEKQAHFLARQAYPEAMTSAEMHKEFYQQYNSAEGRAWRAKTAKPSNQTDHL